MTETLAPNSQAGEAPPDEPAARWVEEFQRRITERDIDQIVQLFQPVSYWRDLVSFTWNLITVEGPDGVRDLLTDRLAAVNPTAMTVTEESCHPDGTVEAWLSFETNVGRGTGHLRLVDGRVWTLLTTLQELKGYEEPTGSRRALGTTHTVSKGGRQTWLEGREQERLELGTTRQPFVVIVGGGQGGIGLAARLRQLGVPTIIVERNARPGDSWRNRYKSLCLHDPVWIDHLPYLDFPSNWPIYTPKDKLGDWLEAYTQTMELTYWGSTTCMSAAYDELTGEWTVLLDRDGHEVTLHPKHLVLATGLSGKPQMPTIPGMEEFEGEYHHSSAHPGAEEYAGTRALVVGSNNSAHDIAAALWEQGCEVTMIQRSSTTVVRAQTLAELGAKGPYSEAALAKGMTTAKADLLVASMPFRIMHSGEQARYEWIRERDKDFYQRLVDAGFQLDFGEDESGHLMKYMRRGSGYYIDVGACELVADGEIGLVSGVGVKQMKRRSVVLSDGSEHAADLVVFATGYGPMQHWAAELISPEVADNVGRVWGHGSGTRDDPGPWEGEQRNMWKPTAQHGLWFHGGNLAQSRHYSRYLALQLKARFESIPTTGYQVP